MRTTQLLLLLLAALAAAMSPVIRSPDFKTTANAIQLGRRALVRSTVVGAAATAAALPAWAEEKFVAKRATNTVQIVGTGGLSSFNKLKLESALKDLADAPVSEDFKPSVDVIKAQLPLITEQQVPDSAKIAQAADAIANLVR